MRSIQHSLSLDLKYSYPDVTSEILLNMTNALATCPKLYTQCCHLMNKINLPPPFDHPPTELHPLVQGMFTIAFFPGLFKRKHPPVRMNFSTSNHNNGNPKKHSLSHESSIDSESEHESDGEPAFKRHRSSELDAVEATINPSALKTPNPLLYPASLQPTNSFIPLEQSVPLSPSRDQCTSPPASSVNSPPNALSDSPFTLIGDSAPSTAAVESSFDSKVVELTSNYRGEPSTHDTMDTSTVVPSTLPPPASHFISNAELMQKVDIATHSLFKNYSTGAPSSTLYVKNLAKKVTAEELGFLFGRFVDEMRASTSNLNIKLMKEGRMRDQAFVSFVVEDGFDVERATRALYSLNGFLLHQKPLVLHFGKQRPPASSPHSL